jgi:glycopeptide antibiotics resistance protein
MKLLQKKLVHLFIGVSTLLIACYLYWLFRDITTLMISEYIDFTNTQSEIKVTNSFLKNNLPDGLFVFSFTIFFTLIWQKEKSFWISVPLLFCCLIEFFQLGVIKGTFDILDLGIYITGYLFAINLTKQS